MSEDTPPYKFETDPKIDAEAVAQALDAQRQTTAVAMFVMAEMANKISTKVDAFATWLLAGFGGAVALMLTNHDAISLVSRYAIRTDMKLFAAAVVVTVIEKYIAFVVVAGSEGALTARVQILEHVKQLRESNKQPNLDADLFSAEIIRPLFSPLRYLVRKSQKISKTDSNRGIRRLVKLSQVQGLLLLIQIVIFLMALGTVIRALPN